MDSKRDALVRLRERLELAPADPWSAVESWTAAASPFFRTSMPEQWEDFQRHTATPQWIMLPRFGGGGGVFGDPEWSNDAEATASESRLNREKAEQAKQKLLSWLQGVIDYLPEDRTVEAPDSLARLVALLDRIPAAIRALSRRSHSRPAVSVDDEYDLQYVLHVVLTASFRDVRPEEWTPSYAGGSSRMDFLLKADRIVVEAKYTRPGLADREVADQLIVDRTRYATHQDCGTLACFVYDPKQLLRYPESLERDLAQAEGPRTVIVIRPM